MAHFAELDSNNAVLRVIVVGNDKLHDANGIEQEELGIAFCRRLFGADTNWVQTSIGNNFRKRYAATGYTYNATLDAFIPPQPYPSWTLNPTSLFWESPVPEPELTDAQRNANERHYWSETDQNWLLDPVVPAPNISVSQRDLLNSQTDVTDPQN